MRQRRLPAAIRPDDSPVEAVRKLLAAQCVVIRTAAAAAVRGDAVKAVHDIRGAIRRYRTLLRIFRKLLAGTPVDAVDRAAAAARRRLGGARDTDVWLGVLEQSPFRERLAADVACLSYVGRLRRDQERSRAKVAQFLQSAAWREVMAVMRRFADRFPPAGGEGRKAPTLVAFAAGRVQKALRSMRARESVSLQKPSAAMHEYRKACRRARHTAEFFVPLFGKWGAELAQRFEALAVTLGEVHDIDAGLARVRRACPRCAAALRRDLAARRRRTVKRFRKLRRQTDRELSRGRLGRALKAAAKK